MSSKRCHIRRLLDYIVTLGIYTNMATVSHKMVGLERMLDHRGVGVIRIQNGKKSKRGNINTYQ